MNNNDHGRALTLPSGGYPVTRYPVNDDTVRKVRRVTRQKNMIVLLFERADRKATTGVSHNGRDPCSPHLETIAMRFQKRFCHGHAINITGFPDRIPKISPNRILVSFIFVFGLSNNDNSENVRNKNIFVDFG